MWFSLPCKFSSGTTKSQLFLTWWLLTEDSVACKKCSRIINQKWLKLVRTTLSFVLSNYTGCPQKNTTVCFLLISPSNLHQIQKGRSVLKSARSEDFKTVLDFQFWPSRSWDIGVRIQQGVISNFSIFAWIYKKLSSFSSFDLSSGLSKPQFDISHYFLFCNIFHTEHPTFNKDF